MRRVEIERNYVRNARNECASYGRCLCALSEMWDRLLRVVSFRCHSHIGANSVFATHLAHTRTHSRDSRVVSLRITLGTHTHGRIRAYWARGKMDATNVYAKERRKKGKNTVCSSCRGRHAFSGKAQKRQAKCILFDFCCAAATLLRLFMTVWHISKHADPKLFCFVVCWFGVVRCGEKSKFISTKSI